MRAIAMAAAALALSRGNLACDRGSRDDSSPEADVDTDMDVDTDTEDTGYPCGPTWEPFGEGQYCAFCTGAVEPGYCDQLCYDCPDGHEYLAVCDRVAGTCRCLIDDVEVCTCTSAYPDSEYDCQPEAWGGANCCWIAG
ncbi:MAG: hypothetical protein JXB39_10800 [Deltaproteobacteria bacterium]|nr:hypothetical protein [Deltaproteobacteria bacterium]